MIKHIKLVMRQCRCVRIISQIICLWHSTKPLRFCHVETCVCNIGSRKFSGTRSGKTIGRHRFDRPMPGLEMSDVRNPASEFELLRLDRCQKIHSREIPPKILRKVFFGAATFLRVTKPLSVVGEKTYLQAFAKCCMVSGNSRRGNLRTGFKI